MKLLLIPLLALTLIGAGCRQRECIKFHTGTFIDLDDNTSSEGLVCDEWGKNYK